MRGIIWPHWRISHLPALSRYFIRTGLIYLLLAFTVGILQLTSISWRILLWPRTYTSLSSDA